MRLLSPARTCRMVAFRTREAQREPHAHPFRPNALLDLNATYFPNTEAVVGSKPGRLNKSQGIRTSPELNGVDVFYANAKKILARPRSSCPLTS